jgi:hypothetical protein
MIDQLRSKVRENQFEFSKHAVDQTILPHISVEELQEVIGDGEVIEDLQRTNTVRTVWPSDSHERLALCIFNAVIPPAT